MTDPEISIILPCLNEEKGLGFCIDAIRNVVERNDLNAELIIVDNASTDRTSDIVKSWMNSGNGGHGQDGDDNAGSNQASGFIPWLRYEYEPVRGYGAAYLRGLNAARGTYIYMADADGTYDFDDIPKFIQLLRPRATGIESDADNKNAGAADMVIGNRFVMSDDKRMEKKAMPWLHKYVGNPVLSGMVRLFFNIKIHDIHCGARAMTKKAYERLSLNTIGMEFASEMIIKASKAGLRISEIPTRYKARIGDSKLRSIADGWRHTRFILLYSPLILFMLPGALLFGIGAIGMTLLYFLHIKILSIELYIHPMFFAAIIMMIGYQLMLFGGFAKTYAITHLGDRDRTMESIFRHLTIEKAGFTGIALAMIGGFIFIYITFKWITSGFGSLDEIKNSIVALTFAIIGIQTFFSAFMLSIVGIKEK
jgi:glycosyltransferase involved in cell wall biosynthesis